MDIPGLVEESEFVGGVYDMGYDTCHVHTTDFIKKAICGGLQRHSFLIAKMDPDNITTDLGNTGENTLRGHALLLRVSQPADLPAEAEIVGARYQNIEEKVVEEIDDERDAFSIDAITRGQIQKTAIEADIIGTFYEKNDTVHFGGDVHSVFPSGEYLVYKPTGEALEWIAGFMQPEVKEEDPDTIPVGDIKYSASELREDSAESVPVDINASDLVGNKTALFGMTRTGKSNTMKVLATAVHVTQDGVGQMIFDPSGEYGNPNKQDEDYALIEIDDSIKKVGNTDDADISLRRNFFDEENLTAAKQRVDHEIWQRQQGNVSGYLQNFIDVDIQNPSDVERQPDSSDGEEGNYFRDRHRHQNLRSAFYAILIETGLEPDNDFTETVSMGKDQRNLVFDKERWEVNAGDSLYLNLGDSERKVGEVYSSDGNVFFHNPTALAEFWKDVANLSRAQTVMENWMENNLEYLLGVLVPKNENSIGVGQLKGAEKFHNPDAKVNPEQEVYDRLADGDTVIIDLSEGSEGVNRTRARRFINATLNKSMGKFRNNEELPQIQIYLEEAHRYFNEERFSSEDDFDPYVRLAKEGAKFKLGLVYATQEVTTVDDRVLANTANWVVTHLNNQKETSALTNYYDFEAFEESIRRVMEKGFARTRFLSHEYTLPVRIKKFTEDWVEVIQDEMGEES